MGQKLSEAELELYRRVDEVLYYVWDPIGVAPNAVTRAEYQRSLPVVFAMLQEGADVSAIATYLDSVATERMGFDVSGNPEHAKRVADFLLDWKAQIYRGR
jgi:hypothetical protein